MTGAGISVASGIPDYRSKTGVYANLDSPEYILSHTCLVNEPQKFYDFVMANLYFPDARPNIVHRKIAEWESLNHNISVITQNVDDLHKKAGSQRLIEFHGSLYRCYCQKCGRAVPVDSYLNNPIHQECGGYLCADTILYEENLSQNNIKVAIEMVQAADVIVIAGSSFKVAPFCRLIDYRKSASQIFFVNKQDLKWSFPYIMLAGDASDIFGEL